MTAPRCTMQIDVEVEDPAWTSALADAADVAREAAGAALAGRAGAVVVLLANDEAVRDLNARFRGKDRPTNVLSFPAPANPEDHLGDIALAYGVCAMEAAAQGKSLADHLRHLVVHGVLHVLGYDHDEDERAESMEALERRLLAGLGVSDPYALGDDGQHAG
jgi:probable rRNA maturation factor